MKYWIILLSIFIIPFALQAGVVEKMLFSNKGYAKQIEVKTYVLTQEQVSELFKKPSKNPIQLTVDELEKITMKIYFVVRVKNLGQLHAWGTLSCKVRCIHNPFKIPVLSIKDEFCDNIMCIFGIAIAKGQNSEYPDISYEWSELYTQ